ncbi:MAG: GIY-YIG nuclease family protein, partial [Candidatus Kerfeldbacteria bacterium]|nr:GIY-YIG nuclease family protein [Candidatus Kerfeldbacteria bacterium]
MSKIQQKLATLPYNPGCYIFKDQRGKILYIGKAKNLKKRVASYFQKKDALDLKTKKLVSLVQGIDFIITDSEVEALLLEARLIRENQPPYNLELKGGIRYAYIRITNDDFSRLETVRLFKRGDKVFGPYALGQTRRNLIQLANTLFKLRVGKRRPVAVGDGHYLIRCSVPPWRRVVTAAEYRGDVVKAELLLKGKTAELLNQLRAEMERYSGREQFELAKIRRDQIRALERLADKHKVD